MLSRLVYYSVSSSPMSLEDIRQILKKSNENNARKSVTGSLYYNESYFIQVLEGGRKEINEVFSRIIKDERHHSVVVTSLNQIQSRHFENWSMLYLEPKNINEEEILKFSPTTQLDLDSMTSENILEFVLHIKRNRN